MRYKFNHTLVEILPKSPKIVKNLKVILKYPKSLKIFLTLKCHSKLNFIPIKTGLDQFQTGCMQ